MRATALTCLLAASALSASAAEPPRALPASALESARDAALRDLVARHGEGQRARIALGLKQTADFWRAEDGDAKAYGAFVREHFTPSGPALDQLYGRLAFVLESVYGHMAEIGRDLRWGADIQQGPLLSVDPLTAGYEPSAHLEDDFFANKLAFAVLLNFPVTSLEQRLKEGGTWTRRQWAETRLAERFTSRVTASVRLEQAQAYSDAGGYVSGYNFWMHHLLDAKGRRLFPEGMCLLSHWNLRDEIKGQYANGKDGLERQRLIQELMTRVVRQEVPAVVIDNPLVDWSPYAPAMVAATPVKDSPRALPENGKVDAAPEPDTRYAKILENFRTARLEDPYSPAAPTFLLRRFEGERQMPEARVKAILESVCRSPLVKEVAKVIEARLKRKLEPFDLWFAGFKPGAQLDERKLDAQVRAKYPNAAAFEKDLPNIIEGIGFARDKAEWLAARIAVDPARGSGHAMGAVRRGDKARLRTRVGDGGMDYKGFNIAVHELGHNVEQTFSLDGMDHWMLSGVPNNAFTEAMAFTFQARDLRLLGQPGPDAQAKAEKVLHEFWQTLEICSVALVEMEAWRWLYAKPNATPAQFKEALVGFAKTEWQRTYGPVMATQDSLLLGIYSHMVNERLYLADYPLGHLIAFQIDRYLEKTRSLGAEVERMCRLGRLTPDAWMTQATGQPVGAEALLEATADALKHVKR